MTLKKYIFTLTIFLFVFLGPLFISTAHADIPPVDPGTPNASGTVPVEPPGMYTYIAPLGSYFGGDIDLRDQNALTSYLHTWFRFAVGIAGVFGVVRLIMVGFSIVMSAPSANAQSKIKNELVAIIGSLVLVAGSWIFLNTLNPLLVTQSVLIPMSTGTGQIRKPCEGDAQADCTDASMLGANGEALPVDTNGRPILADNVTKGLDKEGYYYVTEDKTTHERMWQGPFEYLTDCEVSAAGRKDDPESKETVILAQGAEQPSCMEYKTNVSPEVKNTESAGRIRLKNGDVGVNNTYCANSVARGCTNITGLADEVFNNLIGFAGNCKGQMGKNCGVVLTGGTEGAGMHKTHGLQFNYTYDMSSNPSIDAFLKKNATIVAPSFSHVQPNIRYYLSGWWYNYEGAGATAKTTGMHYHVCMETDQGVYSSDKYWACKSKYVSSSGAVKPFDDTVCKVNPNNANQKICLNVQIP